MPADQLCFFRFERPLLARFGADFFRRIPNAPGVYIFTGESGRVLYVGQSKDLRTRLSYYKNAQPEREPRRIIRLVHQTIGIQVECCDSIEAAKLREVALIGQHRPRFNVAHTLKPAYSFFALRDSAGGFSLRLTASQARQPDETMIGAFKNRGLCGRALRAMGRTVVAESRGITSVFGFPAWLHSRAQMFDSLPGEWREILERFVRGEEPRLMDWTAGLAERTRDPLLGKLYESDLVDLGEFFELARRMRAARLFHDLPILSQEALQVTAERMRQVSITMRALEPAEEG